MKLNVSTVLVIIGVVLTIVSALTLISKYPINISLIGLGIALYLLGKKLKPKA